jgi:hypothetical protein
LRGDEALARAGFVLGRAALGRAGFARTAGRLRSPPEALVASAAVAAAAARTPLPPRLLLRRPGRDLGRLPSTPGSSVLSAATREK